jgi:hypothetical protein
MNMSGWIFVIQSKEITSVQTLITLLKSKIFSHNQLSQQCFFFLPDWRKLACQSSTEHKEERKRKEKWRIEKKKLSLRIASHRMGVLRLVKAPQISSATAGSRTCDHYL